MENRDDLKFLYETQLKAWKKQYNKKNSKYSDSWILKQIDYYKKLLEEV